MNRAFPRLYTAVPVLGLALGLAGCASTNDYPSLARRPAERITGSADVVAPTPAPSPPPAPPSPEMTGRLAQLVEQARAAHAKFAARRGEAERLVGAASGAAPGSESWSVASIALGDLDSRRSEAMVALGELDEIYVGEAVKAAETGENGNANAASAAHAQVNGWLAEEDAILDRLRGRLRS